MDDSLLRRRVVAYLFDVVALLVVLGPTGWLAQRAIGWSPSTPRETWVTLLLNFSLPTWLCFTAFDASRGGATLGKRLLRLRVVTSGGERLSFARALGRTALKLLPWELVHVAVFALGESFDEFATRQSVALVAANLLVFVWFAVALRSGGRASVHDLACRTLVVPSA